MKKFKARFLNLEKVRKIELDRQIKEMALAQRKAQEIELEIRKLHERIRLEIERVRSGLVGFSHLEKDMQLVSADFRKNTRTLIDAKRKDLILALQAIERERRKVVEKQKRKKIITKLNEHERDDYEENIRREEMRQLDEVGSNSWNYTPEP